MASIDYYNDSSQWGNYQYVTLDQVINDYLANRDTDDYTSNVPRYKLLYQAQRGLRELYFDSVREIRAIELDISPTLNVILPPDFVNFVRVSWVDDEGQLHPMAVDSRMNIAQVYLQDHEYNLIFDNNGCVLQEAFPENGTVQESEVTPEQESQAEYLNHTSYNFCGTFQPNKDYSRVYKNGKFRLDKQRGMLQFGSDVKGKSVVLEYISDGLYTGCEGVPQEEIGVHKFAEAALIDFIYYELIKRRRNVPANEKARALNDYKRNKRKAGRRINTIRKEDLMQVFKGSGTWNNV